MNNQKTGIETLEKTLNFYGLPYEMTGNKYPMNITEMSILGITYRDMSAWDVESFNLMNDALITCIEEENMNIRQLRTFVEKYNMTPSEVSGEYVKESYYNSHCKLTDLLQNALKSISYAQSKFEAVFDERATHEFKSTESAFLYNDLYITPCILKVIISEAWKNCTKESQREYLERFYNGNKTDIKTIINDCLADMFNKNDLERLTYLDDLRMNDLQRLGL